MKLPLAARIRKKAHQDIAAVQDLVMNAAYQFFPKAVFHGGTAIWRCYDGNRFSEDIDMYLPDKNAVSAFFQHLQQNGFLVHKQKVTDRSLYSLLEFNRTQVRFEALFLHKKNAILKDYELIDGTYMTVYTLSLEDLLLEKIAACLKLGKVRDLYDIFFFCDICRENGPKNWMR